MIKKIIKKVLYKNKATSEDYCNYLRKIGCNIGEGTKFFSPLNTLIDETRPWLINIGKNVQITDGVRILTHGYDWSVIKGKYGEILGSSGKIVIGNNCFIGVNSTILKGVNIGNNVIIGANSLVNKDIPDNVLVAGNPARIIMTIDEYYEKRKNCQLAEAVELVIEYYKKFNKFPTKKELREFIFLFEKRNNNIEKNEIFDEIGRLLNNYEFTKSKFLEKKGLFDSYDEFLNYCKNEYERIKIDNLSTKKIGIMSMHRIKNYGSFLQAYGLKKNIENLGYEVEFVDYNFEQQLVNLKKTSIFNKLIKNRNIFNYIKKKIFLCKFNKKFEQEYYTKIGIKERNINTKTIDKLVIGSDEVFNCLQIYPVGYSRELFGKNYEDIPVISYAASFGQVSIDLLEKFKIKEEISSLLSKFKAISIRDENSFEIIKKITKQKPIINLDPVLITNYEDEEIDNVKLKNYIIIYAYADRLTKEEEYYIKQFAKKYNKKIVSLGTYQRIANYNLVVNPFEIMPYFKHADFIVTDTFHGSIFSIKTHSKYCVIVRDGKYGNNNKLNDLLKRLKQSDRIINKLSELDKYYNSSFDFSETDKIIKSETKKSIDYLKQNLK